MKLTLTYEFSSVEELNAHLQKGKDEGSNVLSPTKKAAPAKKTKEAEVEVPTPVSQAAEVFPTPPAQPVSPIPAAKPAAPVFDRNMVLTNVMSTVNELKTAGYPEAKLPTIFTNIFTKMGVPGRKLGELDDTTLSAFAQLFPSEVANFKNAFGGTQTTSFI